MTDNVRECSNRSNRGVQLVIVIRDGRALLSLLLDLTQAVRKLSIDT